MKTVHMLVNAHLDPVWQWNVEEGMGAALATFRSAAMLLEKNEDLVFCHNEALLYRWVEAHEPALFARIQALVAAGRWRIMGGFALQPDCVMPGGEAMVRQVMDGRSYFLDKFGVVPRVAVQVDSFGHSRGLVQILAKCGYDGYIFMRPGMRTARDAQDFRWVGLDGSSVQAHRLQKGYNTGLGKAKEALTGWLNGRALGANELFPWGVGNHGGGPSQRDIDDIGALAASGEYPGVQFVYATPEQYMQAVAQDMGDSLPECAESLYPSNVGCYTSLVEIKQAHRRLEGLLLAAEKLSALAAYRGQLAYPHEELDGAWQALMFLQFHDVLPGTHTLPVMQRMLALAGHGQELAQAALTRAFFRMARAEPVAAPDTVPILVANPHPYAVTQIVTCEYMLPDQNWDESFSTGVEVRQAGVPVPAQLEKEDSSLPLDWRKRVAFWAMLAPSSITRFDCHLFAVPPAQVPPAPTLLQGHGGLCSTLDPAAGCIGAVSLDGVPMCGPGLGAITVHADNCDPWHMEGETIDAPLFVLLPAPGVPLRTIEHGPVRTVIEATLVGEGVSAIVRYGFPVRERAVEIDITLTNTRADCMIKLAIPTVDTQARVLCETMFGEELGFDDGQENVSQRYDCVLGSMGMVGVVNDGVYGGSFRNGVLQKNLLRAPVYCAHPIPGRETLRLGRHYDRAGIGVYHYRFVLCFDAGGAGARFALAKRAQCMNEPPFAVSYFPPGEMEAGVPGVALEGAVLMTALKAAEDGAGYIARVFEPCGVAADFRLDMGGCVLSEQLLPFEARTYRYDNGMFTLCDMLENTI